MLIYLQVDICCFDKTGTLTSDDMVYAYIGSFHWLALPLVLFTYSKLQFQEFRGVVGLSGSMDLESDMSKVPSRTLEILASCHALVFVDNKLVSWQSYIIGICYHLCVG